MITPTFANASLESTLSTASGHGGYVKGSTCDVGHMFVQPVCLGKTLDHWDFALSYGLYTPVGKYNSETATLPGGVTAKAESPDNRRGPVPRRVLRHQPEQEVLIAVASDQLPVESNQ